MTEVWKTPAEWAAEGLPGLPTTKQGLNLLVAEWPRRPRSGRGGGWEYPLSALPAAARLEMARRLAAAAPPPPPPPPPATPPRPKRERRQAVQPIAFQALPERHQQKVEAQAAIVAAWRTFHRASGLSDRKARPAFCAAWTAGEIAAEPWMREHVPSVSPNGLRNWENALADGGLGALAPKWGNRKGSSVFDQDAAVNQYVLGLLAAKPHLSATTIMEGLRARFPAKALPDLRSLQRWLVRWKEENAEVFLKVTNPDKWRSSKQSAAGSRSEGVFDPNDLWEMDTTPADLLLIDGSRHVLVGSIDVATRRSRLLVSRSSTAAAVASAMRGSLLAWGVPRRLKIDNGSDYTSKHMNRVYDALRLDVELCPPFTPEAKPHIERFFHTFSHGLFELLAGFKGHNVAEAQDIQARDSFAKRLMTRGETVEIRLTAEQLQTFCDRWCEDVYAHAPHGGLKGKTPWQVAAAYTGPVLRIENERALDILLMPTDGDGWRKVTKKGIRIDNATFNHALLGAVIGQDVLVLFDDADFGHVWVFGEDGAFICKAFCPERTGASRAEVAAETKAVQRANLAEQTKALRAASRAIKPEAVVAEILAAKSEAAGRVALLPRPAETYTTPALDAAAVAARFGEAPRRQAAETDIAQAVEALKAEMAAPAEPAVPATAKDRYRKALALQAAREAGRLIDAAELQWLDGYRRTAEFKTQQEMHRDFGDLYVGPQAVAG